MKTFALATVLAWSLFFFTYTPALAQGGIYKWTDSQGRLHFSNAPTRDAEAVDDALPPASAFGAQPEPTLTTTASTHSPEGTALPPSTAAQVPSADSAPAALEPATEEQPDSSFDEPPAASASADAPESHVPADLLQEESATE